MQCASLTSKSVKLVREGGGVLPVFEVLYKMDGNRNIWIAPMAIQYCTVYNVHVLFIFLLSNFLCEGFCAIVLPFWLLAIIA